MNNYLRINLNLLIDKSLLPYYDWEAPVGYEVLQSQLFDNYIWNWLEKKEAEVKSVESIDKTLNYVINRVE